MTRKTAASVCDAKGGSGVCGSSVASPQHKTTSHLTRRFPRILPPLTKYFLPTPVIHEARHLRPDTIFLDTCARRRHLPSRDYTCPGRRETLSYRFFTLCFHLLCPDRLPRPPHPHIFNTSPQGGAARGRTSLIFIMSRGDPCCR